MALVPGFCPCAVAPSNPCSPSPDSEKSSRAASSLLTNLWQYNKLHRDFRAVSSEVMPWDKGDRGPERLGGQSCGCHLTLSTLCPPQKGYRKDDFLGP